MLRSKQFKATEDVAMLGCSSEDDSNIMSERVMRSRGSVDDFP